MRKSLVALCALMLCFIFVAGCTPAGVVDPTGVTSPDEIPTTVFTTVGTTSAPETTNTTVATTAADEIVYRPITSNKVSSDLVTDPTEPSTSRPTKPAKPNATGDEVTTQRPTYDTSNKKYKYVAFTFDDGPHYELTYKFVNKLAEYGGVGTFFVVGNRVYGEQAKAMKYAYDMGNEIGIHGYTHDVYYHTCSESTFKSELSKTHKVIKNITGEDPFTMRPIGGGITSSRVKSSGYAVINWNVDSNDWRYTGRSTTATKNANVNTIVKNVLNSTDEGDIILMHEIYNNSYDAFCKIIDTLYDRGYRFVTVSQLLGLDESDKGKLYYSAY